VAIRDADEVTHALYVLQGAARLASYMAGWGREHDMGFAALDEAEGQAVGAAWIHLLRGQQRGYGYVDDQ